MFFLPRRRFYHDQNSILTVKKMFVKRYLFFVNPCVSTWLRSHFPVGAFAAVESGRIEVEEFEFYDLLEIDFGRDGDG